MIPSLGMGTLQNTYHWRGYIAWLHCRIPTQKTHYWRGDTAWEYCGGHCRTLTFGVGTLHHTRPWRAYIAWLHCRIPTHGVGILPGYTVEHPPLTSWAGYPGIRSDKKVESSEAVRQRCSSVLPTPENPRIFSLMEGRGVLLGTSWLMYSSR